MPSKITTKFSFLYLAAYTILVWPILINLSHPEGPHIAKWWIVWMLGLVATAFVTSIPRFAPDRFAHALIFVLIMLVLLQPTSVLDLNRLIFLALVFAIWRDTCSIKSFLTDAAKLMLGAHLLFYAGLVFDYFAECNARSVCGDRYLSGTFGNINMAAEYILMGTPFFIWARTQARSQLHNLPYNLIIGVNIIYLCLAQNRSSILALFAMLLFFAPKKKSAGLIAGFLSVVAILMYMISSPAKLWSLGARFQLLTDTWSMIVVNALGVGRNAYMFFIAKYQAAAGHRPEIDNLARHPHNEFISLISEDGFLYFVVLLFILLLVIRKLKWRTTMPYISFLGSVGIGLLVQSVFQFPFDNAFPFFMAAISCGILFNLAWPKEDQKQLVPLAKISLTLVLVALVSQRIFAQIASMNGLNDLSPLACQIRPIDPRVCAVAIATLAQKSDFDSCIDVASRELTRFPDFAPYSAIRGRCYLDRGDRPAACADFKRSLQLALDHNLEALKKESCPD